MASEYDTGVRADQSPLARLEDFNVDDEEFLELMEYVDKGWLKLGYSGSKDEMVFWPTRIGSWVLGMEPPLPWLAG